nr:uncharacterized protein LOC128705400 [Cherax quadricarinatus]
MIKTCLPPDAPVCASGQVHVYGAARNEEVSITCRLDAVPSNVHFFWRFNSSGDVVDIAENHVATQGLQSSLSYVARTELDYGTLLCWGTNALGKQRKPCAYKVVAAGKPNPPEKCNLTNHTTENLIVHCLPGYDGGLQQKFIIEAYEAESKRLLLNITENTAPSFSLRGLQSGTTYVMHVYAANDRGPSEKRYLTGYTIKDVAERRTAQVRPPPEELVSITPILEVVVGVVGSLVLVALVAVVVLSFKKKRRSRRKTVTLTLQKSLTNTRDLDDKNPDLIPANGHGESENKSPTTPEEGGFGSVHICASVPYPSNVYNTYPRSPRPMLQASSQNAELMYAELCFPRGTSHYATGTFTRHKADPTIYAQIDHAMPGTPVSRGLVPLSSGSKGANVVPLSSGNIGATVVPLSSGNIGATIATLSSGLMGSTMAEAVSSNMGGIVGGNMGDSILEMGVSICPGSSMVMCAQEVESGNLQHHNTPTQPAHAFTPSILQEEDEVTADTSLVNDHKESEV